MSGIDEDFKIEIAKHMGCVTAELKGLSGAVKESNTQQKESRVHNDKVVKELQSHFDSKLLESNEEVMAILKDRHLDKDEVRDKITKAIKASEKRTRIYLGAFLVMAGSIVGFVYNYFEAIANFINMLKGN